jgi:chemotaxis protein MotB
MTVRESKPQEKGDGGKTVQTKEQETDAEAIVNEENNFSKVKQELQKTIENTPELKEFTKNLIIDETPEGLRIQIVDRDEKSMFPSGSSVMYDHTKKLLGQVAHIIQNVPNKVSLAGHTDATPYNTRNYTNWELSSDRAHASRRVLLENGVNDMRFAAVVGKEAKEPFVKDDPFSAQNRRISITLLRQVPLKK